MVQCYSNTQLEKSLNWYHLLLIVGFFFYYALFSTHRKIKIWEALGLMHILFFNFLNNKCITDLFLLLHVQVIVFGAHIFTFHIQFSYCFMM